MSIQQVFFSKKSGLFYLDRSITDGTDVIAGTDERENEEVYGTFQDFGLFLELNWSLSPPEAKKQYAPIPSADGSVDITENLAGFPLYHNRVFSFTCSYVGDYEDFIALYNQIRNISHGKFRHLYPPYQDGWFLRGRVFVDGYETALDRDYHKINFKAVCEPLFLSAQTVVNGTLEPGATQTFSLTTVSIPVPVTFGTDNTVTLDYGSVSRIVSAGTWNFRDMVIPSGSSLDVTVTNNTGAAVNVTFTWGDKKL